jgi:hypothetical protein
MPRQKELSSSSLFYFMGSGLGQVKYPFGLVSSSIKQRESAHIIKSYILNEILYQKY